MLQRVNVCGVSRILVPTFFIGMAVAAYTGNDTVGWIVAGAVALSIWVVDRIRGTTATCSTPVGPDVSDDRSNGLTPTVDLRANDPGILRTSTVRSRTPQRKGA